MKLLARILAVYITMAFILNISTISAVTGLKGSCGRTSIMRRSNQLTSHWNWKPSIEGRFQATRAQNSLMNSVFRQYMSESSWPIEKVRSEFINYFETQQSHTHFRSSPVVPVNDPTLLFANAGMNQFKPIFVGTVDPTSPLASLKRAVNSQKCIRAGGKHNDLEDVGKDTYHHTFFEMLGTWSFGNYFKKEAIDWAYDLLVNVYKLPSERLYASYFAGDVAQGLPCDTEARDMWLKYLPAERVLPFDKKANFWEMGETGPCGPCSEIHFDRIGNRDASALVNADDPDVIEIWNLVFIQFNRELSGELRQLPDKHIDTGMGLERLTSILQQKRSNYDTDAFQPIFNAIQRIIGCSSYTGKLGSEDAKQNFHDTAYRVIGDHVRTLTFAIADGAIPSNEGRGYVLRRILRRAVRYGMQTLGGKPGFFAQLVPIVVEEFGAFYPELREKQQHVMTIISEEETSFASLLERGVKYFNDIVSDLKTKGAITIPGDRAFYLYDSLGFPVDLTQLMAAEQDFSVDIDGFQRCMAEQKERSRSATKAGMRRLVGLETLTLAAEQTSYLAKDAGVLPTDDSHKYGWDQSNVPSGTIKAIYTKDGFKSTFDTAALSSGTVGIILETTSFYAEAGGQVADTGLLEITVKDGSATKTIVLDVVDVQTYGGFVLHLCTLADGLDAATAIIALGSTVETKVDYARRRKIAPNHTMTHVLNYALKDVLKADTLDQKGSLVSEDKFRFDFSLNRAMQVQEVEAVEGIVNKIIQSELSVASAVIPLSQAKEIAGLRAVFGEVYPDPVRVISVGAELTDVMADPSLAQWASHSIEFCGGTHISNTREAQSFVVLEEGAVAKGIRRISGVTGDDAVKAQTESQSLTQAVKQLSEATSKALSLSDADAEKPTFVAKNAAKVTLLRNELELSTASYVAKNMLRSQLEKLQKDLNTAETRFAKARVDKAIETAIEEAKALSISGIKTAVFSLNIGSDAKAIKRAIDEIKKASSDKLSFLCISTDSAADKVTVFAVVTEEAQQQGLSASEWIGTVLATAGGRGGGKAGMAQGSAGGATADQNSLMLAVAKETIKDKVIL